MKKLLHLGGLLAGLAVSVFGQTESSTATLTLKADQNGPVINRAIYGHFAEHLGRCIYEGFWVGPDSKIPNTRGIRNDVVAALRDLNIPVLRWPGGCFADEYHWKDGIGPREKRPSIYNSHWGGVVENNHFGTHEFFDLVEMLGCDAYVSANVGSGTVQEMMEWVEYMTSPADSPMANLRRANGRKEPWKLKYLGVGNESWGCGGNMRAEFYADQYRRYNTFAKNYTNDHIVRIACGPSGDDYYWTEKLMDVAGKQMNGLSLHYYTLPTNSWRGSKGSATDFDESMWHKTLKNTLFMDELIRKHAAVMDKYDPAKKVGLAVDEWGIWTDPEPGSKEGFLYQQNSLRDAVLAGINLNIFHKYADRVNMANIAQVVNVLQAMILTDKEKMILTPTYHVFRMYKVHQDAVSVPLELKTPDYSFGYEKIPAVSASASKDKNGKLHISLVNTNPNRAITVTTKVEGAAFSTVTGEILTAPAINAINTFEKPDAVKPVSFTGAKLAGEMLSIELPAKSVVVLELSR